MSSLYLSIRNKAIQSSSAVKGLSEWYAGQMGYRQMGLLRDDLIPDESDVVKEAIRRLPDDVRFDRIFRFRRAINVGLTQVHEIDKKYWTKASEDVPYLSPIIAQVQSEVQTRENFNEISSIPAALLKRNRA
ncbi:cytochrome b-c1 complex subunit 7 [Blyttiomyces helicus]|uniref:Complex III subunit 7 n=1 Tax=Blyttiomyces helicus TaxID=388810 RepID=A0A4V1IS53_9FUNG|nr:cytochrome b-c1 complex subunit 7 [Blyttiomyces helicus]|eukprot:RKO92357.1 cytochrome b-c1 complex subunit 7 [Blyttiomyces helicus]